ncbi:hypothetical protein [Hymenobacter radiodurans]|uniref:hypothetical protein n=1 Tax=Hymenobacter radiodurans TaxID=2496028 RepID=UPI001058C385|nr:hypothetical protein [Hymenobacter radiodurans]
MATSGATATKAASAAHVAMMTAVNLPPAVSSAAKVDLVTITPMISAAILPPAAPVSAETTATGTRLVAATLAPRLPATPGHLVSARRDPRIGRHVMLAATGQISLSVTKCLVKLPLTRT